MSLQTQPAQGQRCHDQPSAVAGGGPARHRILTDRCQWQANKCRPVALSNSCDTEHSQSISYCSFALANSIVCIQQQRSGDLPPVRARYRAQVPLTLCQILGLTGRVRRCQLRMRLTLRGIGFRAVLGKSLPSDRATARALLHCSALGTWGTPRHCSAGAPNPLDRCLMHALLRSMP